MAEQDWLAERFEEQRGHLFQVAYRMLGSLTEADDAVQDAWLRASRAGADGVENLGGWLTTIVARVCLNVLRARRTRPEEPLDVSVPDPVVSVERDPEHAGVLQREALAARRLEVRAEQITAHGLLRVVVATVLAGYAFAGRPGDGLRGMKVDTMATGL